MLLLSGLLIVPYILIISYAWLGLIKQGSKDFITLGQQESQQLPNITVIIAAKDEEACLPALINDLQEQVYPSDRHEIIIVDDKSTDSTSQIIKEADGITYILSKGDGKKKAIACGLENAKGELIITTDSDCRIGINWAMSHALHYVSRNADLLIGQVEPDQEKGFINLFSALEFHSLQAVTAGLALSGRPVMCNGANLSFKRSAIKNYLESVRNDISSGDDMFLLHSIKKAGGKIVWLNDQESKVHTRLPHRFIDLLRQRSRWAGKSIYYRDADTIITGLAAALANLSIVIISILSIFLPGMWKILILLLAVKAIPDILLLSGHLRMKKKISLLSWFIPVSVLYPFYTVLTFLVSLFRRSDW